MRGDSGKPYKCYDFNTYHLCKIYFFSD